MIGVNNRTARQKWGTFHAQGTSDL